VEIPDFLDFSRDLLCDFATLSGSGRDLMSGKRRTKQMKNQPILAQEAVTTASGAVVADWQRLPCQLLHEFVQKNKLLGKPEYLRASCPDPDLYRSRVRIRHLKSDDRSLNYAPDQSHESFELAKEYAALFALHHLCGSLALERKLPDPFRSAWLSFSSSSPLLSSKARFHTEYDRMQSAQQSAQKQKQNANRRDARDHFRNADRNRLAMDNEHRQMVEHVLRQGNSTDDSAPVSWLPFELIDDLSRELIHLGFERSDVDEALLQAPFPEADRSPATARRTALDWLLGNVAEARLPQRYRARDSSAVVAVGVSDNLSIGDRLSRLGFPSLACDLAMDRYPDSYEDARSWLWQNLVAFLFPDMEAEDGLHPSDEVESEKVALAAIYDEAFDDNGDQGWTVQLIDLQLSISIQNPIGSRYPAQIPEIALQSPILSSQDRMRLIQALIQEVAGPAARAGTPLTHSAIQWLYDSRTEALRSYRLTWPSDWILAPAATISPPKTTSERPARSKPTPAVANPDLDASLLEKWRRRSDLPAYAAVVKQRARLPVWRERRRLVDTVKDHNVVVICAETGSGKSTQIPAFMLDDGVGRGHGATCRVICTQPRRISAISLAERVAYEYSEKVRFGRERSVVIVV